MFGVLSIIHNGWYFRADLQIKYKLYNFIIFCINKYIFENNVFVYFRHLIILKSGYCETVINCITVLPVCDTKAINIGLSVVYDFY